MIGRWERADGRGWKVSLRMGKGMSRGMVGAVDADVKRRTAKKKEGEELKEEERRES